MYLEYCLVCQLKSLIDVYDYLKSAVFITAAFSFVYLAMYQPLRIIYLGIQSKAASICNYDMFICSCDNDLLAKQ